MLRPAIGQMLPEKQSIYSLVVGIAKRARQIVDEKNEKEEIVVEKPVKTAVEEFAEYKFTITEDENIGQKTEL